MRWLDDNRHEFEQALGDGEGQGSLVCFRLHVVAKSWTKLNDQHQQQQNKIVKGFSVPPQ